MVCIFAFYEDDGLSCWRLISKSDLLNHSELKYFVKFYGLDNLRLRCGDFDFYDN